MSSKKHEITQNHLREVLDYDAINGDFRWKKHPKKTCVGSIAGTTRKGKYPGYRIICINRVHWYAHRLAWLYMTGEWPFRDIDHINGDRSDNRWANLRLATRSQNLANKKIEEGNVSGYKGVWLERNNKYYCHVRFEGINVRGGPFFTAEAAFKLREAVAKILHGEFARSE